jgi:bacterioferritin-associated ferredoxin
MKKKDPTKPQKHPQFFPDSSLAGQKTTRGNRPARDPRDAQIVCLCNNVSRATVEDAIRDGAVTLNQIFDFTTAGVGACGGSCRRVMQPMLDQFLENGTFPEKLNLLRRRR